MHCEALFVQFSPLFYYGLFHKTVRTFVPIPLFSAPFHARFLLTSRSKFWCKTNYYILFCFSLRFSNRTLTKCESIWTENSKIFPNIHCQIRYMWILRDVSWRLSGSTSVTIGRTRLLSIPSRATMLKPKILKYFERNKVKLQNKMREDILHANARLSHWKAVLHVEIV